MSYKLYILTDPRTPMNIRYVGITSQELSHRLSAHINDANNNIINHRCNWLRSLLKENIQPKIELVDVLPTWEAACEAEIREIKILTDDGYKLVNGTMGGEGKFGYMTPEETRTKISAANKGKKSWLGLRHTSETKLKMSGSKTGKNNPMYGRTREKHPMYGTGKPVLCITTNQYFSSLKEAAIALNVCWQGISAVCRGKVKHTGGYQFQFLE